ncbi:hypothetical protein ACV3J7_20840 [Salmonella enterica]
MILTKKQVAQMASDTIHESICEISRVMLINYDYVKDAPASYKGDVEEPLEQVKNMLEGVLPILQLLISADEFKLTPKD